MAGTKNKVKESLVKRIYSLSRDKFRSLEVFLAQLENEKNNREEILSFAGSLKDIDLDLLNDLTDDLHENRKIGSNRIP